jgi:hypothetical protein
MRSWLPRPRYRRRSSRPRQGLRPVLEALEERWLLDSAPPIVPNLTPTPQLTVSTVPANGDLNPYGVAFVPKGFAKGGPLHTGDILVSNFNNSANQQGTGTTIVQITQSGNQSLFFQGPSTPGQLGLTTALGVLKRGFVIVGSLPTLDGTSGTIQAPGSLLVLDKTGNVVLTLSDSTLLDGPWDMTINDQGERAQVFVSNVLSGTVTRIDLKIPKNGNPTVQSETQIASGYLTRTDPAALVVGPTGLAYDREHDILYVASTGDNEIFSIADAKKRTSDAGMGTLVYQDTVHLHGPLGLLLASNGDLVSTQGDAVNGDPTQPSEIVEFTTSGQFVAQTPVDQSGQQGGAFGIALQTSDERITFAAVDDINNTLEVWQINTDDGPRHDHGDDHATVITALTGTGSPTSAIIQPGSASAPVQSQGAPAPAGATRTIVVSPTWQAGSSAFGRASHAAAVDLAFAELDLARLD